MGRSRREGPAGGLGWRRAITGDRPPSAFLRRGSNATFRMQCRALPVCSLSRGPGAGSQLASVSEIRNRSSGGGRWANTPRTPQSPVLNSARGGAGQAMTLPRAGVWGGSPCAYPARGALGTCPRGGSAFCACKRERAGGAELPRGRLGEGRHPAGEKWILFSSFQCYKFAPFP